MKCVCVCVRGAVRWQWAGTASSSDEELLLALFEYTLGCRRRQEEGARRARASGHVAY